MQHWLQNPRLKRMKSPPVFFPGKYAHSRVTWNGCARITLLAGKIQNHKRQVAFPGEFAYSTRKGSARYCSPSTSFQGYRIAGRGVYFGFHWAPSWSAEQTHPLSQV